MPSTRRAGVRAGGQVGRQGGQRRASDLVREGSLVQVRRRAAHTLVVMVMVELKEADGFRSFLGDKRW